MNYYGKQNQLFFLLFRLQLSTHITRDVFLQLYSFVKRTSVFNAIACKIKLNCVLFLFNVSIEMGFVNNSPCIHINRQWILNNTLKSSHTHISKQETKAIAQDHKIQFNWFGACIRVVRHFYMPWQFRDGTLENLWREEFQLFYTNRIALYVFSSKDRHACLSLIVEFKKIKRGINQSCRFCYQIEK